MQRARQAKAAAATLRPRHDSEHRQLWLGDVLIKEFRVPALSQERILIAFEEQGWPDVIDDPLPGAANIDAKARLHGTIARLNGAQINRRLQFYGDGTGERIGWRLLHR